MFFTQGLSGGYGQYWISYRDVLIVATSRFATEQEYFYLSDAVGSLKFCETLFELTFDPIRFDA